MLFLARATELTSPMSGLVKGLMEETSQINLYILIGVDVSHLSILDTGFEYRGPEHGIQRSMLSMLSISEV